jgi:hypothetical protein
MTVRHRRLLSSYAYEGALLFAISDWYGSVHNSAETSHLKPQFPPLPDNSDQLDAPKEK